MNITYQDIQETAAFIRAKGIEAPQIGIILGTGLGGLVKHLNIIQEIDYASIPHFPVSTVESHKGKLIYGELEGKKVLAMQGRFHYYEGYTMQQITLPVRVMKLLGIQQLLISNAAGAVNLNYKKGTLMLLDDHINLLPENPLTGKNINELGPRFPDMSHPYDKRINELMTKAAKKEDVLLHKGVYASVPGPNLETRAEYRYIKIIGGDAVGMSTVPEVIVANHMNLPCAAVSVLTDECDPDNLHPVSLKEILDVAAEAEKGLVKLFKSVIKQL
ncbi:purine-nucleoside phosphorylase [Carboxylicivirga mesophila]|uniref:Purine nucleoside phosphorylase n=1 Tax=Carboxylicivirga mesophila TaxID=1166478 RepID=A0ABS5K4N9_9BACT|nr:purine-nucleoside phosphorylase [Carboxylicivirga mesophila]MBS2209976.1 purine-nucleoside phosphorylase [Carboxylicivirga mesophila]